MDLEMIKNDTVITVSVGLTGAPDTATGLTHPARLFSPELAVIYLERTVWAAEAAQGAPPWRIGRVVVSGPYRLAGGTLGHARHTLTCFGSGRNPEWLVELANGLAPHQVSDPVARWGGA